MLIVMLDHQEQFGKDWDLVPIGLDPSDAGAQTPGMAAWGPPPPITTGPARYTSASNVWHMGMVRPEASQA